MKTTKKTLNYQLQNNKNILKEVDIYENIHKIW